MEFEPLRLEDHVLRDEVGVPPLNEHDPGLVREGDLADAIILGPELWEDGIGAIGVADDLKERKEEMGRGNLGNEEEEEEKEKDGLAGAQRRRPCGCRAPSSCCGGSRRAYPRPLPLKSE